MKKNNDLISIVVPCYNVENCVKICINSIKHQTYKNLEILFIDDGSKDSTKDVVEKLIKNDKRFHYYFKKNGGLSDARNYGLKKAKGKYICFIDSDDYVDKKYIEKLYKSIIKNNSKISICDIKRVYKDKITIDNVDDFIVETCIHPAAWNKMYLKELFDEDDIIFPVGKWYEDLGTTPKLTFKYKYSIVKEPLYNYVQNNSSIMHTYDDRIFDIYKITDELEEFAKNNKLYEDKYSNLEFISIYHILIGTIYRASFHKDFSIKMIKDIYSHVNNKYPNWHKNKYIKNLPLFYRLFLTLLRFKAYFIIYLALKLFGKYLSI